MVSSSLVSSERQTINFAESEKFLKGNVADEGEGARRSEKLLGMAKREIFLNASEKEKKLIVWKCQISQQT